MDRPTSGLPISLTTFQHLRQRKAIKTGRTRNLREKGMVRRATSTLRIETCNKFNTSNGYPHNPWSIPPRLQVLRKGWAWERGLQRAKGMIRPGSNRNSCATTCGPLILHSAHHCRLVWTLKQPNTFLVRLSVSSLTLTSHKL